MERVRGLPGATGSSPKGRKARQAEKTATLTLREFEQWLAIEVAREGIRVNAVCPAGMVTHFGIYTQHPAHFGDELGQRVVQLCAQCGQFPAQVDDPGVTEPRVTVCAPGIADRVGQACGVGVTRGTLEERRNPLAIL